MDARPLAGRVFDLLWGSPARYHNPGAAPPSDVEIDDAMSRASSTQDACWDAKIANRRHGSTLRGKSVLIPGQLHPAALTSHVSTS